jgi:hypothetical protein
MGTAGGGRGPACRARGFLGSIIPKRPKKVKNAGPDRSAIPTGSRKVHRGVRIWEEPGFWPGLPYGFSFYRGGTA